MYADDAAIFIAPVLLGGASHDSAQFWGSDWAYHKSSQKLVVGIKCDNVDLDNILQHFPAIKSGFPMKYLGRPLSLRRLRQLDFQPLEDKVAAKLAAWKGELLTRQVEWP